MGKTRLHFLHTWRNCKICQCGRKKSLDDGQYDNGVRYEVALGKEKQVGKSQSLEKVGK